MRFRFFIPIVVVAGLMALLAWNLLSDRVRSPEYVPSPLVGKPVPHFDVATLDGSPAHFTQANLAGRPAIINFFASWCVACKVEHPLLMRLARADHVKIIGVDYKDSKKAVQQDLAERGNPYHLILQDPDGTMGLNFGVYGVPETYLVGADGVVKYKAIGPLTPREWRKHFVPVLKAAR